MCGVWYVYVDGMNLESVVSVAVQSCDLWYGHSMQRYGVWDGCSRFCILVLWVVQGRKSKQQVIDVQR